MIDAGRDDEFSPPLAALSVPDAIRLEGLTKIYNGTAAVDHISFSVPRGSTTGLLGGNGAGKTTTIGMIMGLITPSEGKAFVLGQEMRQNRHKVLAKMNFESPYVDMPHRLTVRQNLRVFGQLYGLTKIREKIEDLAESLMLRGFLDRETGKLSAGQKTRVAIAKALLNDPQVLLLDEPTASLDPDTADWVRTHLETYRRDHQASILLASHNMAEVERLCDRVIVLKQGVIAGAGSPKQLLERFNRENLEEVFLDLARGRQANGRQEPLGIKKRDVQGQGHD